MVFTLKTTNFVLIFKIKTMSAHKKYQTEEERKEARRLYGIEWRKKHKEQMKKYEQERSQTEKRKQLSREMYAKHSQERCEKAKEYYAKNSEVINQQRRDIYKTNKLKRAKCLCAAYKQMDRKSNVGECTLEPEWIVENIFSGQHCDYCPESDWTKLGCDRIDNQKPHTPDNVVCCCTKCNVHRKKIPYLTYKYGKIPLTPFII